MADIARIPIQPAAAASALKADAATLPFVAATVLAWASAFPAIRAGLHDFGPLELGAIRFAIAALPAALYLAVVRPALPSLAESWRFVLGSIGSVSLYTVLINLGELTVSAGAAAFIVNVAPIVTAVLAMIVLGERFRLIAWLGTALSFSGIGLIALGEGSGLELDRGALYILAAAVATSVATVMQKPLFARHGPLTVSAWNMVLGAAFLAPALPSAWSEAGEASTSGLVAALYLGLIPSFLGYATWTIALSRMPASRATNFLFAVPPTATLMGFLLLGEVPTGLGIIGGLLALGGVVLVNVRR